MKVVSCDLGPKKFSKSKIHILTNYEQLNPKRAIVFCTTVRWNKNKCSWLKFLGGCTMIKKEVIYVKNVVQCLRKKHI